MSNYFRYCTPTSFFYHGGGIEPSELFSYLLQEEEIEYPECNVCNTDIDSISIEDFMRRRELKQYADDLIEEVERKTIKYAEQKPMSMVFYYVPMSHDERGFSFVLCALTRVDNNGQTTIFAPLPEYLTQYTDKPICCSE